MDENAIKIQLEHMDFPNETVTISPIHARLFGAFSILFCILLIITVISVVLNFKSKNKKRIIYQIVLSIILLVGTYYLVNYPLDLFEMNYSNLIIALSMLFIGNILTFINIFKK